MNEPSPVDAAQARGCIVAFFGMVLLTLVPAFGNFVEIDPAVAYALLAAAVLLLFAGAAIALIKGRGGRRP